MRDKKKIWEEFVGSGRYPKNIYPQDMNRLTLELLLDIRELLKEIAHPMWKLEDGKLEKIECMKGAECLMEKDEE